MKCDCFYKAKEALRNEGLGFSDLGIAFNLKGESNLCVGTKRVTDKRPRIKPKQILLSFCPFCGMEAKDDG